MPSVIAGERRDSWWLGLLWPPWDTGRWPHTERFKHSPKLCCLTCKKDRPCGKLPSSGKTRSNMLFTASQECDTVLCVTCVEHLSDALVGWCSQSAFDGSANTNHPMPFGPKGRDHPGSKSQGHYMRNHLDSCPSLRCHLNVALNLFLSLFTLFSCAPGQG